MRHRFAFVVLSLACAAVGPVIPACSSNGAVAEGGDAGDGGIPPNQLVGAPCDPAQAPPCAPAPSTNYGCFTVACVAGTCVESQVFGCTTDNDGDITFFEGGSVTSDAGVVSCTSSAECPSLPATDASAAVILVCGFSAFDQCSTSGLCVLADPPRLHDGAVQTACGCNGESVPYLTDNLTSAPVETSTPCTTAGSDAGTDAADAAPAADAGLDDAAIDDAATDAPIDAPSNG